MKRLIVPLAVALLVLLVWGYVYRDAVANYMLDGFKAGLVKHDMAQP